MSEDVNMSFRHCILLLQDKESNSSTFLVIEQCSPTEFIKLVSKNVVFKEHLNL